MTITAEQYTALPVFAPHTGIGFEEILIHIREHSIDLDLFRRILNDVMEVLDGLTGPSGQDNPDFELQFRAGQWLNDDQQQLPLCVMQIVINSEVQCGFSFALDHAQKLILKYKAMSLNELMLNTLPPATQRN